MESTIREPLFLSKYCSSFSRAPSVSETLSREKPDLWVEWGLMRVGAASRRRWSRRQAANMAGT